MATNKNITMKQFNGTDYDTLYPKTTGAQITGAVPIASGGTNGTTASSGVNNLVAGLSQITPASNDLFPFRDISGNTGGSVTLANLVNVLSSDFSTLGFTKIQTGSYIGTGTYGENNPNTLTFNFAPKLLWFVAYYNSSENQVKQFYSCYILSSDALTTSLNKYEFTGSNSHGDYSYASKSSDGKTFSWYNTAGDAQQFNTQGMKYYWLILG